MKDYLVIKRRTGQSVRLVMRDGFDLVGPVEAISEGSLFLVAGWWIAPEHVLRARPAE